MKIQDTIWNIPIHIAEPKLPLLYDQVKNLVDNKIRKYIRSRSREVEQSTRDREVPVSNPDPSSFFLSFFLLYIYLFIYLRKKFKKCYGGPRFESLFFCLFMYVCKGFGRIYTEQLRSGIHKVVPTWLNWNSCSYLTHYLHMYIYGIEEWS